MWPGGVRFLFLGSFEEDASYGLPDEQALGPGLAFEQAEPAHVLQFEGLDVSLNVRPGVRGVPEGERHVPEMHVAGQQGKMDPAHLHLRTRDGVQGALELLPGHYINEEAHPHKDDGGPKEYLASFLVNLLHGRSF